MAYRPLAAKPGSQGRVTRPDRILSFTVADGQPAGLLEFLFSVFPDSKRTTVKDYLKHHQVMVNGNVSTLFDSPVRSGDTV